MPLWTSFRHVFHRYDVRRLIWLDDLLTDLRYAFRSLTRQPAFFAVAILTLALGIGANIAIFSLVDAVMLRALPVSEPQRLVQVTRIYADGQTGGSFSLVLYEYLRVNTHAFDSAFAQSYNGGARIDVRGVSERVNETLVSGGYYRVLGVQPAAGRLLQPPDDVPGAPAVAVISHAYWRRRFSRDASAIGATLLVNGTAVTIVGVTPAGFSGTLPGVDPDLTFPLSMYRVSVGGADDSWRQNDGFNFLSFVARLKPDTTLVHAAAEIEGVFRSHQQSLAEQVHNPNQVRRLVGQHVSLVSAQGGVNRLRTRFSQPLWILMASVGLVFLLACANLSSLLVARASARTREMRIRCAIGAGRGRLVRQLLAESFLLAALGTVASFALSGWFSSALVAMMANGGDLVLPTSPDWRLMLFSGGATLAATILVGLVPAVQATRAAVRPGLDDVRAPAPRRIGRALLIGQIAISLVLLVGATLFIGTLVRLYAVDAGFRKTGVLTFRLDTGETPASRHRQTVESDLLERIGRLPGVESTSAAQILFMSGGGWNTAVRVEGYTPAPNEELIADVNVVAPRFFETMGTPIVAGRDFTGRDSDPSEPADNRTIVPAGGVAIVNESFARAYFQGRSPLGRHLTFGPAPKPYEIVGVVKDAKYLDLKEAFPRTVYFALGPKRPSALTLLVHTASADPTWIVPQVEAMLHNLDPAMHLQNVKTFAEHVDRAILNERIMATLGAFFGALALVIACLGVFGVMAFQVSHRTREFGVRMALGATRSGLGTLVLRDVFLVFCAGTVIGGAAAIGLTRIAGSLLFEVTPTDPALFAVAIGLLGLASFAAGYIPARRAARVDPIVALRHE